MSLLLTDAVTSSIQIYFDRYIVDGRETVGPIPACIVVDCQCPLLYVSGLTAFTFVVGEYVQRAHFHKCDISALDVRGVPVGSVVVTQSKIELLKGDVEKYGTTSSRFDDGQDERNRHRQQDVENSMRVGFRSIGRPPGRGVVRDPVPAGSQQSLGFSFGGVVRDSAPVVSQPPYMRFGFGIPDSFNIADSQCVSNDNAPARAVE